MKKGLIIGGVILLLIAIVAAVYLLANNGSDEEESKETPTEIQKEVEGSISLTFASTYPSTKACPRTT